MTGAAAGDFETVPNGFGGTTDRRRRSPAPADEASAPTKTDNARFRSAASARDKERSRAYRKGQAAHSNREGRPTDLGDPELTDIAQQGYDAQRTQARAATVDRALGGSWGGADDWAGVILGAIVYALVLSYVRYGWAGPKAWFASKFTNATPSIGATPLPAPAAPGSTRAPSGTILPNTPAPPSGPLIRPGTGQVGGGPALSPGPLTLNPTTGALG
jgi:hypothetical protein